MAGAVVSALSQLDLTEDEDGAAMADEGQSGGGGGGAGTGASASPKEESERGQRGALAPEGQAGGGRPASEGGQRDDGAQSGPEGAPGRAAEGSPEPRRRGGEGAGGAAAGPTAQAEPGAPTAGGEAAPSPLGPGSLLEFSLMVRFGSPLQAEMAHRALLTFAQRQEVMVHKELTVAGSVLTVKWTAEDLVQFQISVNKFLDLFRVVMRNIRRLETLGVLRRSEGNRPEP